MFIELATLSMQSTSWQDKKYPFRTKNVRDKTCERVILYVSFNSEVSMKAATLDQLMNLCNVDFSGKGGKENEIAAALYHKRSHKALVDAVDERSGILYEYKKQAGDQWFDLHKLSLLTKEQKNIDVLFFFHKDGVFEALYTTTYQGIIDAIGLTKRQWNWAKKAPVGAQVKHKLKRSQVEKLFTCVFTTS
jgi:hypothetical protein